MQFPVLKQFFGTTASGMPVYSYTIRNDRLCAEILDYGATIRSLLVRNGDVWTDVVLGYDTLREYEENGGYVGACIGRVGNRIGNGFFTLNGQTYTLCKNDGPNHLHGGMRGFDKQIWEAHGLEDGICFSRVSPDGEEGYPGTLSVQVSYRLQGGTFLMDYQAVSDQDTLCSLTNHSYFNLNGAGSVLGHRLQISANEFLENDENNLPTGKRIPVEGTPFDFRTAKPVGQDIRQNYPQLRHSGYDHNFCLASPDAAVLTGDISGISMAVHTTLPGIQFYTANSYDVKKGKHGAAYAPHCALCLETQYFPNAMACAGFARPILQAGKIWSHRTSLVFEAAPEGSQSKV